MEALTPPAQLSEWHMLAIKSFRTVQAILDLQPKDDVIGFADFILIAAAAGDLEEKLDEVSARLPEDIRRQMIEVGCIDPEDVPDDREDATDDHGNDIDDATAIRVGADVRGALDYDGDIDFFRFQAERGQSYQIDVALGTLDDSIVFLYDGDRSLLDINDDGERLFWEAPSSGEGYVAVEGYGIGTYTLTVSLSDLIDDHGNSEGRATAIRVGADVRGALDYDGDIDFFRFQAERGQSYQIDVALGTLDDSELVLLDPDGRELAYNGDYGDTYASRLYWEAPSNGVYYVAVTGYGIGTYTLTVSSFGDHGNDFESATRIAIGEAVAIELESLDDMDVLVFRARPGTDYVVTLDWETYNIWDNPGSIMALYDAGGRLLARLNDYDFSAQRIRNKIMWQAVNGGDYYIVIGDENTLGNFALTVEDEVGDDHGDTPDNATSIEVGEIVEGRLEAHDADYFRFQAERGQSYQIDVALGTLDDSIVQLYDVDWSFLDSNVDYGDTYASRLYWEAPSSGERYVAVEGYGTGTYTLTVSIVDDHGDTAEDGVGVASDRAALVALYNAMEGGSWTTRTNWLSGRPLDEWHGVTTDSGGRVTALNLVSNRLVGALPAALGDLTNLRTLILWSNDELTGPIPAWLGDLTNLRWLILGGNGLTGEIPPELAGLSNLTSLDLRSNGLTGEIPPELASLSNLQRLYLNHNRLTGEIPPELASLSNLTELYLNDNRLTGEIPPELAGLSNLTSLDLRSNGLTGEIPPELASLSNLQRLYLNHNRLTGEIPPELASLSNLTELYLNDNRLTGEIPPELGRLSNLMELGLYANQLTGEIPPELAGLSNLTSLDLRSNGLTGEIPPELGGLSNLTSLILNSNRLTGGIPPELGGLSNLDFLWLRDNQLTGCIPEGLRDIEANDLWELELPDCGLEGRPTASSFVSVSAAQGHSCGVRSDGSVACWGSDEYGQATPPADSFVSVSAGVGHTCGVRSNGSVACWGWYRGGQTTPPAGSFVSVSAGEAHTCGVRSGGSVACWGSNVFGQATPPAGSFISVSAGGGHNCGVRNNGSVACWGSDEYGRATPPAGSFVSVSAGALHSCGVRSNGSVACWGYNVFGQATPPASSFVSVNVGAFHTCGVRSNGSVACWGSDVFGKATPPAGSFVSVSAGVLHTCGVRIGGSVACWGSDEYGQATPPAPTATAPPATPTAATNIAPTPKPFPERTHVILRVVQVTEDWVPFSDASGWTQAVLQKESDVLRYYEAAIWEETDSVHLYAFPNDYDGLFGLRRENVPDADVIGYREQHAISVHSDMPEAWGDRRSDFLRIAFEDFVSRLVERHPEADHHLMYSGHGGPGGALFAGQLKHDDADVFLATWTRLLGKPLGVIDMGGPCNKGAYEDLANFCRHASYYVASDLPNGGYSEDEWTSEKHHETDPETQYHRLLASNETLEEALIERVELRRKKYEYSMNNQIRNQVEQANYVYSCARFNDFSEAFESFVDGTTIQAPADDLYQLMLDYSAPPALLDRFRDVFVHGVDNRDFFEWKVTANGMLSPSGG